MSADIPFPTLTFANTQTSSLQLWKAGEPFFTVTSTGELVLGKGQTIEEVKAAVAEGIAGAYTGICLALIRLYELENPS